MKEGDLVTLSTYALQMTDLYKWRNMVWKQKKPLVGLIVSVEDNPYCRSYTSQNEKRFYYVKWMQAGPASRWGNRSYYRGKQGYFLRNDLKFVRAGDFKNE